MLPVLVSIPHCSYFVPHSIREKIRLSEYDMRNHADLYTERIYDIPETFQVKAATSRLVIDPNRDVRDIEDECEECFSESIVLETIEKQKIYTEPVSWEEMKKRVKNYHQLYHWQIEMYLPLVKFLIDGHSMYGTTPPKYPTSGKERPQICLGTRDGETCSAEQAEFFYEAFKSLGYEVLMNNPFKGKYIMEQYCSSGRIPGMQIEINQGIYMDEKTLEPNHAQIDKLNHQLSEMVYNFCIQFFPDSIH